MGRKEEENREEAKMEEMHFKQQIPLLGVHAAQCVPALHTDIQSQCGDVSEVPLLSWLQGRRVKQWPMLSAPLSGSGK